MVRDRGAVEMETGMKRLAAAAAALLWFGAPAFALDPLGDWLVAEQDAKIRIQPCGGALCGVLVWSKQPNARDVRNPDPALRSRSLVGVPILTGLKPTGPNAWAGQAYNADDGRTYDVKLALKSADTLRIEGCVLGGLICQGEDWTRAR